MIAYLGDYVQIRHSGDFGRVFRKYPNFGETGADDETFQSIQPALSSDAAFGAWCSILLFGGGEILMPEFRLLPTEPFELDNPMEEFYFRE